MRVKEVSSRSSRVMPDAYSIPRPSDERPGRWRSPPVGPSLARFTRGHAERRSQGTQLALDQPNVARSHAQEMPLGGAQRLQPRIDERVGDDLGPQLDLAVHDRGGDQRLDRLGPRRAEAG